MCPDIKNKPSSSNKAKKPFKKKALKAIWDSESESEEEVDTANMCFKANDNTPKVISEPSLDECHLTMNELGDAFVKLSTNYDFLKKKYLKMKKENEVQSPSPEIRLHSLVTLSVLQLVFNSASFVLD